jgi:hypothetical protein
VAFNAINGNYFPQDSTTSQRRRPPTGIIDETA